MKSVLAPLAAAFCLSTAFCFAQAAGVGPSTLTAGVSNAKVVVPRVPGKESASLTLMLTVQNESTMPLKVGLTSFDYTIQDAEGRYLKQVVPPGDGKAFDVKPKTARTFKTELHVAGGVPQLGVPYTLVVKAKDFDLRTSQEFRFSK